MHFLGQRKSKQVPETGEKPDPPRSRGSGCLFYMATFYLHSPPPFLFIISVTCIYFILTSQICSAQNNSNVFEDAKNLTFQNPSLQQAYIALQTWKASIYSDPFNVTSNWNGPKVCTYSGVFCAPSSFNSSMTVVARIDLNHGYISGSLPPEIGLLNNLTVFDVSFNKIQGQLLVDISQMKSLEELNVARNRFTGIVPESICQLPRLQNFKFSFNYFTGKATGCVAGGSGRIIDDKQNCIAGESNQRSANHCRSIVANPPPQRPNPPMPPSPKPNTSPWQFLPTIPPSLSPLPPPPPDSNSSSSGRSHPPLPPTPCPNSDSSSSSKSHPPPIPAPALAPLHNVPSAPVFGPVSAPTPVHITLPPPPTDHDSNTPFYPPKSTPSPVNVSTPTYPKHLPKYVNSPPAPTPEYPLSETLAPSPKPYHPIALPKKHNDNISQPTPPHSDKIYFWMPAGNGSPCQLLASPPPPPPPQPLSSSPPPPPLVHQSPPLPSASPQPPSPSPPPRHVYQSPPPPPAAMDTPFPPVLYASPPPIIPYHKF